MLSENILLIMIYTFIAVQLFFPFGNAKVVLKCLNINNNIFVKSILLFSLKLHIVHISF